MAKSKRIGVQGKLKDEYLGADLGDARLNARLPAIGLRMGEQPEGSFPEAAANDAELEATYRFVNNRRVSPEAILAPHVRQTVQRASTCDSPVVAHDTSEFSFGTSSREDLGPVGQGGSYGFYGHFALVVDPSAARAPLGVVSLEIVRRSRKKKTHSGKTAKDDPENEFHRWGRVVEDAQAKLASVRPIHVMDREADSYELMAQLVHNGTRFVIRLSQSTRRVAAESGAAGEFEPVGEAVVRALTKAHRDVPIAARSRSPLPAARKRHPPREARTAHLEVSATTVTLQRPHSSETSQPKTLTLNVVRVSEPEPPTGESPIEWRLWTTEPVNTEAEILAVVDFYRCRWRIEEFFKALKQGCAIEKRQLESHRGLVNTVALMTPIAWRLLNLRTLAREPGHLPAAHALSPRQLLCLAAALHRRGRPPLPAEPNVRDVMLGVAALGGHIKNNGEPGWIVLGRGLDDLLMIELGYILAKNGAEI
jgi:hypothetical protein